MTWNYQWHSAPFGTDRNAAAEWAALPRRHAPRLLQDSAREEEVLGARSIREVGSVKGDSDSNEWPAVAGEGGSNGGAIEEEGVVLEADIPVVADDVGSLEEQHNEGELKDTAVLSQFRS